VRLATLARLPRAFLDVGRCYDPRVLARLKNHFRRRKYVEGAELTRFVAKDVRRDVLIVDAARLDEGVVVARTRTWNVLYASNGLAPIPSFGDPREVAVDALWRWNGELWGGPVPVDEGR
jgi:hypothetical protein